jgi:hypothetical protein
MLTSPAKRNRDILKLAIPLQELLIHILVLLYVYRMQIIYGNPTLAFNCTYVYAGDVAQAHVEAITRCVRDTVSHTSRCPGISTAERLTCKRTLLLRARFQPKGRDQRHRQGRIVSDKSLVLYRFPFLCMQGGSGWQSVSSGRQRALHQHPATGGHCQEALPAVQDGHPTAISANGHEHVAGTHGHVSSRYL